jgi:alcohol dehydrogenase class IV
MLPDTAIVDPELTVSMPPAITASTGLDALTHLMEVYLSKMANPMTDAFCRRGMACLAKSLRTAWCDGENRSARESMALASLYGGFALANAKLGAVHGFAGPLGGLCGAPHGQVCARLLPFVMRANLEAIPDQDAGKMVLSRYAEVAGILTGGYEATPASGVAWVERCCSEFDIPTLADLGMKHDDVSDIVGQAMRSSSMQGNPMVLSEAVLKQILLDAC